MNALPVEMRLMMQRAKDEEERALAALSSSALTVQYYLSTISVLAQYYLSTSSELSQY